MSTYQGVFKICRESRGPNVTEGDMFLLISTPNIHHQFGDNIAVVLLIVGQAVLCSLRGARLTHSGEWHNVVQVGVDGRRCC